MERGSGGSREAGSSHLKLSGITPDGFRLVAAFDGDRAVVGQDVAGLLVRPMDELDEVVQNEGISIAIVAVPVDRTQGVIDQVMACVVQAILNYAPIAPQVMPGVKIRNIDPVVSLQSMTYYLNGEEEI